MTEKDIVDFEKMKNTGTEDDPVYEDENGEDIGCEHCYTHIQAYKKFKTYPKEIVEIINICPICGKPMEYLDNTVIGEVNYPCPDGKIGEYPVYRCDECDKTFAFMPTEVEYNGNHDTWYTGGRDYLNNDEQVKLSNSVFDAIKPSIEQYVRKVTEEHNTKLSMWNILLWCERDVEHVIANWLYEHHLKK